MMIGKFLHDPAAMNFPSLTKCFDKEKIFSYSHSSLGRKMNFLAMAQWIYDCNMKKVIKSRNNDYTPPSEEELCWLMLQAIPYK